MTVSSQLIFSLLLANIKFSVNHSLESFVVHRQGHISIFRFKQPQRTWMTHKCFMKIIAIDSMFLQNKHSTFHWLCHLLKAEALFKHIFFTHHFILLFIFFVVAVAEHIYSKLLQLFCGFTRLSCYSIENTTTAITLNNKIN